MADEFVVERYQPRDRELLFAFVRAVHSDSYAERLIHQWDWKFEANPFNREAERSRLIDAENYRAHMRATCSVKELDDFRDKWGLSMDSAATDHGSAPYVLLLRTGNEIVGIKCSVPGKMRVGGRERWIGLSCDWALHSSFRNRRLAPRLSVRLSADHAFEIGWRNAQSVRQGRPDTELSVSESLTPYTKRFRKLLDPWRYRIGRLRSSIRSSETIEPIDQFGDEFDEFWQRAANGYDVIGVRDRAYLTWRYGQRPDADYSVLAARREGRLTGFIVFRSIETGRSRRGYLVDFLVESRDYATFKSLVGHAETQICQEGCTKVETTVIREPFAQLLRKLRYEPAPMGSEGALFVAAARPDPINETFLDLSRWFITMGDGDLDMSR